MLAVSLLAVGREHTKILLLDIWSAAKLEVCLVLTILIIGALFGG